MSTIPENLKYLETHEWIRVEGNRAVVGITDFAQESLGDIVYVEVPEVGKEFSKGDEVATIESVKAASSIYAPFSGKIAEVNEELGGTPEAINQKPYEAFIFVVELTDPGEAETLLDASGYQQVIAREESD